MDTTGPAPAADSSKVDSEQAEAESEGEAESNGEEAEFGTLDLFFRRTQDKDRSKQARKKGGGRVWINKTSSHLRSAVQS